MKVFTFFSTILFTLSAAATRPDNTISTSFLDKTVQIEGFGSIKYREPVVQNDRFPILLVHGIYGGASHRTFRQLLPLLDQAQERVFILDLPGAGESDKPKRPYQVKDFDIFLERFIDTVIKDRTTLVAESLLTASALRVSALRPDLVRRLVLINPSGVNSLNGPPSQREQALYDRLYNNETALDQFYQNLLVDNSLKFFLRFGFYDDSQVNETLLNDFRALRSNIDQKYLTLSFVGGQLYRSFAESSQNVFVPTLAIFGSEYENFADTRPSKADDFKKVRPDFEYLEIENSGSSVQREKPAETSQAIINFSVLD
ncbi:MAG: alpha/beta fold hydrolase [Bdellovibrionales bacterium]